MLGARSPENHAGAAARVFLAARPDAEIERFLAMHTPLERLTPWTIVDPDQLRIDLARVREQGYAVSDQEVAVGMYGVAAPIYDRREALVGAITLSAPILRAGPEEQSRHIVAVTEAARRISTNLGSRAVQTARNSA
jgi:DNA-binding IclR family transcriptional regulator